MHPNLAPEVNRALEASDKAWGFNLHDLPTGTTLEVQTVNTLYTIRKEGETFTIQGNGQFCKKATPVRIVGCTFGGSMIKLNHLFEGGYLELVPQGGSWEGRTTRTSQIKTVRIL
jgi:hypothetical protein